MANNNIVIPADLYSELEKISKATGIKLDNLVADLLRLALVDKRHVPWIKGGSGYFEKKSRVEEAQTFYPPPIASSPGLVIDVKP